jgi:ketosteroid isomerase-like protein
VDSQRVRQLFDVIDGQEWNKLTEFFCEDVHYERPGYEPINGIAALLTFYRDVRIIQSGRHHLDQVVIDDSAGACWGRFLGQSRKGDPIDVRFADVYSLHQGKIRLRTSYFFVPAV